MKKLVFYLSVILATLVHADAAIFQFGSAQFGSNNTVVTPDFFVATTGSDANNCTSSATPCLTIAGAQTKLRAVLGGAGQSRAWTVQVAGGTYELTEPLVFTAADSGGSTVNRVTWQSAPGQTAVISGGRDLGTGWTNVGGIWEKTVVNLQTGLWNPRSFWVDDQRRLRPRAPGFSSYLTLSNYGTVGNAPGNSLNQFVYSGTDVNPSMLSPTDAEVGVFGIWTLQRARIAGIVSGTKTITTTSWTGDSTVDHIYGSVPDSPTPGSRYFIDNVYENLATQDGTFYIRRDVSGISFVGKIQYKPKVGETINTNRMVIPVLDNLMFVTNRNDGTATVNNITFKGLHFAHTNIRPSFNTSSGEQAGMKDESAIYVAGATNIIFDGVTVRNTGGTGITLTYGCGSCQIINSNAYDTGSIGFNVSKYIPEKTVGSVSLYNNQGQNMLLNPDFKGFTGTTRGANWGGIPNPYNGITQTFTTGQENGIPYVDVALSGTNTAGTDFDVYYYASAGGLTAIDGYPVVNGESIFVDGYIKLASGTTTGINLADYQVHLRNNSTFLSSWATTNLRKSAATLTSEAGGALNTRYMFNTLVLSDVNVNNVTGAFRIQVKSGANLTTNPVTIRFGGFSLRTQRWWPLALGSDTGPQDITSVVLKNNKVQGTGRINAAASGITVNNATGGTIENNHVEDTYGPGYELGYVVAGGSCSSGPPVTYVPNPSPITTNLLVKRNFAKNIGQNVTSDFAGIYLAGNSPGSRITENIIQNVNGYETTSPAAGIYIDEDGSNVEIDKNTIHTAGTSGIFHHFGINLNIHNNIIVNPGTDILTNNWTGAAVSQNMLYRCAATNANFTFQSNAVQYTETATDFPRIYGNNNEFVDVGPVYFSNNRFDIGGQPANPLQWADWTQWNVTNGQDVGTTFGALGLTGTIPFVYPTNKPAGWVDFTQANAGNTTVRTLPTQVVTFP
jgi:hypothetical protein